MRTRIARLGLRAAYAGLVVWSRVARPDTRGVKCALVRGGDVLLVRHSYGPGRWDLPGGFCRRGEASVDAARREVAEELGIAVDGWREVGPLKPRVQHGRRERTRIFSATVATDARPAVASAEIADLRWFERARLPGDREDLVDEVLALAP